MLEPPASSTLSLYMHICLYALVPLICLSLPFLQIPLISNENPKNGSICNPLSVGRVVIRYAQIFALCLFVSFIIPCALSLSLFGWVKSNEIVISVVICRFFLQARKLVKELVEREGKRSIRLQKDPFSIWLVTY